jgi:hypothetical protein
MAPMQFGSPCFDWKPAATRTRRRPVGQAIRCPKWLLMAEQTCLSISCTVDLPSAALSATNGMQAPCMSLNMVTTTFFSTPMGCRQCVSCPVMCGLKSSTSLSKVCLRIRNMSKNISGVYMLKRYSSNQQVERGFTYHLASMAATCQRRRSCTCFECGCCNGSSSSSCTSDAWCVEKSTAPSPLLLNFFLCWKCASLDSVVVMYIVIMRTHILMDVSIAWMACAKSTVGIDFVANGLCRGMLERPTQGPASVPSVDPAGRRGGDSDTAADGRGRPAYAAPATKPGSSHRRGGGSKSGSDAVGESASDPD